jgi:predicted MFS family arabinose efflux permease
VTASTVPGAEAAVASRGITAEGHALASLRHQAFRTLLASNMALQVGSWVQTIGMGWLVINDMGGSASNLATVALLRGASLVLISPVGGYLAGRFDRRNQLLLYNAVSAAVAGALALLVATGDITLWMLYATALIAGAADALAGTNRSMLVYDTVGKEDLTNAVALNALGGNAMRVIGPAIGGGLIGVLGTQGTFQVQAACIIGSMVLMARLPLFPPDGEAQPGIFRSIGGGIAYVVRDRGMLLIVAMGLVPSLLVYPYVTFLPVFAKDVMGSDQSAYGFLAAAVGVGSLLGGGIVAVKANRAKLGWTMMWSCLMYCVAICAFTLAREVWVGVAILCVAGVFHSIYSAMQGSLMQLRAATEYRSQVMSLQTMMWGTTPFAGLAMGRMIDGFGAPQVVFWFVAGAAVITVAIAFGSREVRRI